MASSALSFADNEVGGIDNEAEFDENLTGYLIRRTPRAKTGSHATKIAGIASDVGDSWIQRTRQEAAAPSKIVVRKVAGRWQPVTESGAVFRGNVYNADGTGYSTRQGAEEAAAMGRKLGKSA